MSQAWPDRPLRSLYIDFNAFFASVEQQVRPQLRGQPLAVLPVRSQSTSCIAASYEARRHGVKTGTPVWQARQLCPGIRFVVSEPKRYVDFHHRILAAIESCTPVKEVCSIDEMHCELSIDERAPQAAMALAQAIKRAIQQQVGSYLRCSIGIAANRWQAKMATELQKPDGLVLLQSQDLPERLYGLDLASLNGIGPRMLRRLLAAGIGDVKTLCTAPRERLRAIWRGVAGDDFWRALHGEWLEPHSGPPRHIGHSHVLPPALRSADGAVATLHRLLHKAISRLREAGCSTAGLYCSVKCRDAFDQSVRWRREAHFPPCNSWLPLIHALEALLDEGVPWRQGAEPVAISIALFDLSIGASLPLFADGTQSKVFDDTIDRIRHKYGRHALYFAAASQALDSTPPRIAFNRIPKLDEIGAEYGEED